MAFVLVTIGFSMGRQSASSNQIPDTREATAEAMEGKDYVDVYAAHMTFRCFECTQIETLARELLDEEFADLLEDGLIRFHAVDYMKDPAFASRYDVPASVLVLSRVEDGREAHFERLDDVWLHVRNRDLYMSYVRDALRAQLEALRKGEG
jgi:hypothetical protein